VVGALAGVGVVTFELKATDTFGGVAIDKFSVAVAAPEPPTPTLPSQSYIYEDEQLPLPGQFASSVAFPPGIFWDTPPGDNPITNAGATLGRVLFYDKRLSVTNTHSCASCHEQARGFGSRERFDTGVLGVPLKRHSMALANARFNVSERYFSDQRIGPLEALALLPIEDSRELGSYLPQVETKLAAASFYPPLFEAAFGSRTITRDRIGKAIGQFLRSMMSYRAKFDTVYSGEVILEPLMTPQEMRGLHLFQERPSCVACHGLNIQTVENARNNGLDATITDPGVIDSSGPTALFRVPSLRNVAVSAPYMHDGRFATLREVIDHYDHGVQDNPALGIVLREDVNPNKPPRRLDLSEEDKQALEAFLRTLTDDAFLTDPKFSDPFL
jgi:cytochrome c peroxidase